jgi:hypothetical protein
MKRIMLLVTVALVMAAMMVAMAMPAFAQPGGSENSCGKAGELRTGPQTPFLDCGVKNNPNYSEGQFPPGGGLAEG